MKRIRITQPKNQSLTYLYKDILHDALVNAWILAGAEPEEVVGPNARPWHFGALGWRRRQENAVHTLVVGTYDQHLSNILTNIRPEDIQQARALTGEAVDFSAAKVEDDPAPVIWGQKHLGALMLSPLVVSVPLSSRNGRKWQTCLTDFDASAAISARLTRLTGRKVNIRVLPDTLYLRSRSRHDVLVRLKKLVNGKEVYVIGMKMPLVLEANEEDLALAWYAGIGEKNRNGFGCIGSVDRGVGR